MGKALEVVDTGTVVEDRVGVDEEGTAELVLESVDNDISSEVETNRVKETEPELGLEAEARAGVKTLRLLLREELVTGLEEPKLVVDVLLRVVVLPRTGASGIVPTYCNPPPTYLVTAGRSVTRG